MIAQKPVDRINTQFGWVFVHEELLGNSFKVIATKDGEMVAAVSFEIERNDFAILRSAQAFVPGKGLASSLVKWVWKTYEWKIASYDQNDPFWQILLKLFGEATIDPQTGEQLSVLDPFDGRKYRIVPEDPPRPRYKKGYALTNSFPMKLCEGVLTIQCE